MQLRFRDKVTTNLRIYLRESLGLSPEVFRILGSVDDATLTVVVPSPEVAEKANEFLVDHLGVPNRRYDVTGRSSWQLINLFWLEDEP